MFGRVPKTSLHIVAFRLKYFLVGGTFNDSDTTDEQTNKQTNKQTTDYMGIINVRCLFRA